MRLSSPLLARNVLFASKHTFPNKRSNCRNFHLMNSRPYCTSPDLMEIDSSSNDPTPNHSTFKVLSYNLWYDSLDNVIPSTLCQNRFREDVVLEQRMKAVGDIIQQETFPEFLCFQVLASISPFYLVLGGHSSNALPTLSTSILRTILHFQHPSNILFYTSLSKEGSGQFCFSRVFQL